MSAKPHFGKKVRALFENPGREIINAPEFVGSTWEKEDLMTRASAPLSPHEETTLRRVALGV